MKNLLVITLLALLSTSVYAQDNSAELKNMKEASAVKFLKLANDPKSDLGKRIATFNEESTDGRNQQGTIALPIKRSALQLTVLDSEVVQVPFHYADLRKGICYATDHSLTLMVSLATGTGGHYAYDYGTLKFVMTSTELLSFRALSDNCEMDSMDEKLGHVKTQILVIEPKEIQIQLPQ